jgi:hypothetical protein
MAKLGAVIDQWMEQTQVAISAAQCWTSLEEYSGVVPCTVMSMMSENLISSACDVDICGVVGEGEFTDDPLDTFGGPAWCGFQSCRNCSVIFASEVSNIMSPPTWLLLEQQCARRQRGIWDGKCTNTAMENQRCTSNGCPEKTTGRVALPILTMMLRRNGGSSFDPLARRSVNTRRASCQFICTPIHSPLR